MEKFPGYDVNASVNERRKRLNVVVTAQTNCGPIISASHEINLLTLGQAEIRSGTQLCAITAYEKLKSKAAKVARECTKEHNH